MPSKAVSPRSPFISSSLATPQSTQTNRKSTANHAAREVANVLAGKGPTTEIKDPSLLPKHGVKALAACKRIDQ